MFSLGTTESFVSYAAIPLFIGRRLNRDFADGYDAASAPRYRSGLLGGLV